MKIAIIGGGPAGLYFAISMKLRKPDCEVEVFERNKPGDTFGWGVVFSDQTLENLEVNDLQSAKEMADNFAHWDDIDIQTRSLKRYCNAVSVWFNLLGFKIWKSIS